jgi:hypothetical protein
MRMRNDMGTRTAGPDASSPRRAARRRPASIRRLERRAAGVLCGLLILAPTRPALADPPGWESTPKAHIAAAPVVEPGERRDFPVFDLASGPPIFPGGIEVCVTYPSIMDPQQNYSGSLSFAVIGSTTLFNGAACTSYAFSDFKVAPSPSGEPTPVDAYISGAFEGTGVLALVGMGKVEASFWVDLLDVTEPNNPRVVLSKTLASDSLSSDSLLSVNLGLSIDGGSATLVQVGVEPEVGIPIGVQIKRSKLIEGINFDVRLQRGRTYRFQVNASGRVIAGAAGGIGAAVFVDELALLDGQSVPDMLSRQYILERLAKPSGQGGIGLDLKLPKLNLTSVASKLPLVKIPKAQIYWPSAFNYVASMVRKICNFFSMGGCGGLSMPDSTTLWNSLTILNPSSALSTVVPDSDGDGLRTSNDILTSLNLPTDLTGLLSKFISASDKVFGSLDDWVQANRGGAMFTDLSVTIMSDEVDLLAVHDQAVSDRFDIVDQRFDIVDGRFNSVDQQLSNLSNQLSDTEQALLTRISDKEDAVLQRIDQAQTALNDLIELRFAELNAKLDAFIEDTRQLRIKEALVNDWSVIDYMLPEHHGGRLTQTIQIVQQSIAAMQAANQNIGPALWEFQTAEIYRALGDYKAAYYFYVRAYRAAAQYVY